MYKAFVALLISWLMTPPGVFAQTQLTLDDREMTLRMPAIQFPTQMMHDSLNRESVRSTALPPGSRQQPPQKRSWPGRHPVLFGALLGLGAGLAIEAAVIPGASGGEPHSAYIPMFACTGAGIGALVGLIVSAARR